MIPIIILAAALVSGTFNLVALDKVERLRKNSKLLVLQVGGLVWGQFAYLVKILLIQKLQQEEPLCIHQMTPRIASTLITGLMALDDLHKKVLKTSKSRQDVTEYVLQVK